MNTIRKCFDFINRLLDASINIADETVAWSEELTDESKMAREAIQADREVRRAELAADAE